MEYYGQYVKVLKVSISHIANGVIQTFINNSFCEDHLPFCCHVNVGCTILYLPFLFDLHHFYSIIFVSFSLLLCLGRYLFIFYFYLFIIYISCGSIFYRYITYSKEEEAARCIQSVHGFVLDGRSLR
jgi:hypothetical protein